MMLQERLVRLNLRSNAGLTTWWRRKAFYGGAYRTEPKWHILESYEIAEKISKDESRSMKLMKWTAKCGYEFHANYILGEEPMFKDLVKTAKIRCKKCEKKEKN